jgi:hypothetical protein
MKNQFTSLFYLLLTILALSSSSCKKDYGPELPPETQEGKNTFGCKVNGEIWLPIDNDNDWKSGSYDARFSKIGGAYIGAGKDDGKSDTAIRINLDSIKEPFIGTININSGKTNRTGNYFSFSNNNSGVEYYTDSLHTGSITFTRFDTVAKIMSGRFEFKVKEAGGNGTVIITDGRFDLRYQFR